MTDHLTNLQKIRNFLSEMSEEARKYFFPGTDLPFLTDGQTRHSILYDEEIRYEDMQCSKMPPSAYSSNDDTIFLENESTSIYKDSSTISVLKNLPLFRSSRRRREKEEEEESPVADLELDNKAKAILAEIDYLQEKYGITIRELEALLFYRVKLSRLHITTKKELLLEDFDQKEVRMDTLTKAVFLLYLRHPEGIRYKALSDHQRELEEIYSSITGREDLGSIRKSVADLCDPLNNSINEKVSKVKKAFRDTVDDHIAKFYYIDGDRGTAKRIALDRRYVIWDT